MGGSVSAGSLTISTRELALFVLKIFTGVVAGPIADDVYVLLVKKEKGAFDERLSKIETARQNLVDALSAIDDMKTAAQQHQAELVAIQDSVMKVGLERDQLSADRDLLAQLTAADKDRLRAMIGAPTRLQSVLIWFGTFIFGAVMSWVLTIKGETSHCSRNLPMIR